MQCSQEKVFTPLKGKGVKLLITGKPADNFFAEIDSEVIKIKVSKKRLDEWRILAKQCDWSDKDVFLNKKVNRLNLFLKRLKNKEKYKLEYYAKDLAKWIIMIIINK